MTDAIHEQLSAFVDGELSAAESELFLKRVERDAELRARIGRYVLGGEALRATRAQGPSRDFAARLSRVIERESAPRLQRSKVMQWLKPIAGGAIAAGVAAVALVSLQVTPSSADKNSLAINSAANTGNNTGGNFGGALSNAPGQSLNGQSVSANAGDAGMNNNGLSAPNFGVAPSGPASYIVPSEASNRPAPPIQFINNARLANYVVAHSEYSSPLGQRNMLSELLTEEPLTGDSGADSSQDSQSVSQSARTPALQKQPIHKTHSLNSTRPAAQ